MCIFLFPPLPFLGGEAIAHFLRLSLPLIFLEKNTVADVDKVTLYGRFPPIEKMDQSLNHLGHVKFLSLSTNNISQIANLGGCSFVSCHPCCCCNSSRSIIMLFSLIRLWADDEWAPAPAPIPIHSEFGDPVTGPQPD